MVPSTAWVLRRKQGMLAVASVLWIAAIIAILSSLHWYHQQPYSLPEKYENENFRWSIASTLAQQARDTSLTILLMSFPVLAAFLTALPRIPKRVLLALLAGMFLLITLRAHGDHSLALAPWLPNMITSYGPLGSGVLEGLGVKPVILPTFVRVLMTLAIFAAGAASLGALLSIRRFLPLSTRKLAPSWEVTLTVLGPFTIGYVVLLLPRAVFVTTYDRYLIPLVAILLIPLLRFYQEHVQKRTPRLSFAALAVFGGFGVASTHDYFATDRARLEAAEEVRQAGVPRTEMGIR